MNDERFLRWALRANAFFSGGVGLLVLLAPTRTAEALRLPEWLVLVVGASLVGYGVALFLLANAKRAATGWAVLATALDVSWVLGSAVLLQVHETEKPIWVAIPGAVVAMLAAAQLEGLRRATFDNKGIGRFTVERRVSAPSERAWAIVSDVERYAEVAGTLHRSVVLSGSGLGMIRQCEDKAGVCWLETCSRWEPGRAYAFDVDTSAPNYPLPLRTMRGDFEVDSTGPSVSTIRIRFAFTARGHWFTQVILATTFAARGDAIVGGILSRWATRIETS